MVSREERANPKDAVPCGFSIQVLPSLQYSCIRRGLGVRTYPNPLLSTSILIPLVSSSIIDYPRISSLISSRFFNPGTHAPFSLLPSPPKLILSRSLTLPANLSPYLSLTARGKLMVGLSGLARHQSTQSYGRVSVPEPFHRTGCQLNRRTGQSDQRKGALPVPFESYQFRTLQVREVQTLPAHLSLDYDQLDLESLFLFLGSFIPTLIQKARVYCKQCNER